MPGSTHPWRGAGNELAWGRPGVTGARLKAVVRLALVMSLGVGAWFMAVDSAMGQDGSARTAPSEAVSADHISEGLKRPELQIPPVIAQEPTFRSGVTEKLETPLDVIRRELREEAHLHPWQGGRYTKGVDVLPALMSLVTKIKTIRREHAEAEAREMVKTELEAFCAQHDCSQAAELPLEEGLIVPK
jgi:hypothetical protein